MNENRPLPSFLLAILLFIPAAVSAESPALALSMRIIENDSEIGQPSLVIKEGADASMSMSGEAGYDLELVVNSLEEGRARVRADIGTAENAMSSELVVNKGEWAAASEGDLKFHVLVRDHAATE